MASPSASSPAASAPAGGTRLVLQAGQNEVRYAVREQLASLTLPNEAVGRTRDVTGEIIVGANGTIDGSSSIVADLRTLESDQRNRDNFVRRNTLQTERFPTTEFRPREAIGLPNPLPTSGTASFRLTGDLTVRGVTRPSIWEMSAEFGASQVKGAGRVNHLISEFGMEPPKAGPVVSIEDAIRLEIDFLASRG